MLSIYIKKRCWVKKSKSHKKMTCLYLQCPLPQGPPGSLAPTRRTQGHVPSSSLGHTQPICASRFTVAVLCEKRTHPITLLGEFWGERGQKDHNTPKLASQWASEVPGTCHGSLLAERTVVSQFHLPQQTNHSLKEFRWLIVDSGAGTRGEACLPDLGKNCVWKSLEILDHWNLFLGLPLEGLGKDVGHFCSRANVSPPCGNRQTINHSA